MVSHLGLWGGEMNRILALCGVGLLCVGLPAMANAAAFGIEMGTPLSSLGNVQRRDAPNVYEVTPPQPHSEFDTYLVLAAPVHGVCKIVGIGKDHLGDRDGTSVRGRAAELTSTLTAKYGSSKLYDFLHAGSIWKDAGDWAMALRLKERSYARFWNREFASTLPSDVEGITLEAGATGPSTTYLRLTYEFTNMDQCLAPQKKKDEGSL